MSRPGRVAAERHGHRSEAIAAWWLRLKLYRIVARRKGYEAIRLADKTKQFANVLNEPKPREGATQPKLLQPVVVAAHR